MAAADQPERRPATLAEARAVSNPLRLRILRLCLDDALTNRELAERLGKDPATVLHHVRTLVDTGFLAAEPVRRGTRGAREKPYRATGKSWTLDIGDAAGHAVGVAIVDAFRHELVESGDLDASVTRLGVRLSPADRTELIDRLDALAAEFKQRDNPSGEPVGIVFGVHRRRRSSGGAS
ncbi:MAG: winged helix-turn-helix domain-containing protein [Actinobacteria bacterium]|nr:winged helix-turn-helix domain-containing protein [Actinomycetota bacterium]